MGTHSSSYTLSEYLMQKQQNISSELSHYLAFVLLSK